MMETKVTITPATKAYPKFTVQIQVLKFDNIRQEDLWVTKEVREFRSRADAERFAARAADLELLIKLTKT
jgi:hypothetical protein